MTDAAKTTKELWTAGGNYVHKGAFEAIERGRHGAQNNPPSPTRGLWHPSCPFRPYHPPQRDRPPWRYPWRMAETAEAAAEEIAEVVGGRIEVFEYARALKAVLSQY